jgi:hypothetical protein
LPVEEREEMESRCLAYGAYFFDFGGTLVAIENDAGIGTFVWADVFFGRNVGT